MMNAEILLPCHLSANTAANSSHDDGESPESSALAVPSPRLINQARKLVKRTLTPNQHDNDDGSSMQHSSCDSETIKTSCCSSPPSSPISVAQLLICDESLRDLFASRRTAAAIALQAVFRGTLARWNLPVLKLQHKLVSIQAVKEKQLKKLKQRTEQAKRSLRAEVEYRAEHRIVRRRLRRAKCIRNQYAQEKVLTLELNQHLKEQCMTLQASNDECASILRNYIQSMEMAQHNLNMLGTSKQHLEASCETYRTILEVFREQVVVIQGEEVDEP